MIDRSLEDDHVLALHVDGDVWGMYAATRYESRCVRLFSRSVRRAWNLSPQSRGEQCARMGASRRPVRSRVAASTPLDVAHMHPTYG